MPGVTVRSRKDGIVELAPRDPPTDLSDRLILAGTVLLVALALFFAGMMPALALAAIAASCVGGEIVLAVRALALVLLRPVARVHELPRWQVAPVRADRRDR